MDLRALLHSWAERAKRQPCGIKLLVLILVLLIQVVLGMYVHRIIYRHIPDLERKQIVDGEDRLFWNFDFHDFGAHTTDKAENSSDNKLDVLLGSTNTTETLVKDAAFDLCPSEPPTLAVYPEIFGGVIMLKKEIFLKANGFSNMFWGWGGEDDNMLRRLKHFGYKPAHTTSEAARYKMLPHAKRTPNPDRFDLLSASSHVYEEDQQHQVYTEICDTSSNSYPHISECGI